MEEKEATGQWSEYIEMPDLLEVVRGGENGVLVLGKTEEDLCESRGYQRDHVIVEGGLNLAVLRKAIWLGR